MADRTRIFVSGVGGQGSITSTLIIGEAAAAAGLNVVASEVHGMAQRGGIVETTVLVGDVHGPMVGDGAADVLLGFEPAEALRFLRKASPDRTLVLMNRHPIIPIWVSLGKEEYPSVESIEERVQARAKQVFSFDARELASQAGTAKALGSVMLGALAGLGLLAIPDSVWLETILSQVPRKYREANEKAFAAGLAITR